MIHFSVSDPEKMYLSWSLYERGRDSCSTQQHRCTERGLALTDSQRENWTFKSVLHFTWVSFDRPQKNGNLLQTCKKDPSYTDWSLLSWSSCSSRYIFMLTALIGLTKLCKHEIMIKSNYILCNTLSLHIFSAKYFSECSEEEWSTQNPFT